MTSATAPTSTKAEAERVQRAMDASYIATTNCMAACSIVTLVIFLLGSIAVFGVGIWLVTSFDSSTDNFKGGIAAIVLGGSVVFALVCAGLVSGCGACVGCTAYQIEMYKQKKKKAKNSSADNKPADVV